MNIEHRTLNVQHRIMNSVNFKKTLSKVKLPFETCPPLEDSVVRLF